MSWVWKALVVRFAVVSAIDALLWLFLLPRLLTKRFNASLELRILLAGCAALLDLLTLMYLRKRRRSRLSLSNALNLSCGDVFCFFHCFRRSA